MVKFSRSHDDRIYYNFTKKNRPELPDDRPRGVTDAHWQILQRRTRTTRKEWREQRDYEPWLRMWHYGISKNEAPGDLLYVASDGITYEQCADGTNCPTCDAIGYHDQTIVVSVSEAYRRTPSHDRIAAYGIFVSPDKATGHTITNPHPTRETAELEGTIAALRSVQRMRDSDSAFDIERVVIKSDFEYVVKGMTTRIQQWKASGYLNSDGKPLVNSTLFRMLDDLVLELNDEGVGVQFWQVSRDWNDGAERWAQRMLDMVQGITPTDMPRTLH
ncbi:hypothetical protein EV356DRAFT_566945 [Viridothelium virens]|uniref:RNase H type-1 domain-containing protein n=1 Tax=Viridothelium virens TaxID=1048519 RepID=A0A6A6HAE0_VIRVR|nr:hypothetical protein EV356DRAFT_566945 [Viridothelium virens]